MAATSKDQSRETVLYSYRVASADLKYIEINTREVHLRMDPDRGPILRGELPECGASCHASLSEVFLEHAMSCKGCEDEASLLESMAQFGRRLGEIAAGALTAHFDHPDPVPKIFDCIVASMGAPYRKSQETASIRYTFNDSPFEVYAEKFGLHLYIVPAQHGFTVFMDAVLKTAGPAWHLAGGGAAAFDSIRLQRSG